MNRLMLLGVLMAVFNTFAQGEECRLYDYSGTLYPAQDKERYVSKEGGFSAEIPRGWPRNFERFPYQSAKGDVIGVEVNGPKEAHGVALNMVLAYYRNGGLTRDYQGYVALRANSFVRTDPTKEAVLKHIEVDGKKGFVFEMETFELVYEETLEQVVDEKPGVMYRMGERLAPSKQVIIWNKDVVVPLGGGFFVARFSIPRTLLGECESIVDEVLGALRFHEEMR